MHKAKNGVFNKSLLGFNEMFALSLVCKFFQRLLASFGEYVKFWKNKFLYFTFHHGEHLWAILVEHRSEIFILIDFYLVVLRLTSKGMSTTADL